MGVDASDIASFIFFICLDKTKWKGDQFSGLVKEIL